MLVLRSLGYTSAQRAHFMVGFFLAAKEATNSNTLSDYDAIGKSYVDETVTSETSIDHALNFRILSFRLPSLDDHVSDWIRLVYFTILIV